MESKGAHGKGSPKVIMANVGLSHCNKTACITSSTKPCSHLLRVPLGCSHEAILSRSQVVISPTRSKAWGLIRPVQTAEGVRITSISAVAGVGAHFYVMPLPCNSLMLEKWTCRIHDDKHLFWCEEEQVSQVKQ